MSKGSYQHESYYILVIRIQHSLSHNNITNISKTTLKEIISRNEQGRD